MTGFGTRSAEILKVCVDRGGDVIPGSSLHLLKISDCSGLDQVCVIGDLGLDAAVRQAAAPQLRPAAVDCSAEGGVLRASQREGVCRGWRSEGGEVSRPGCCQTRCCP